MLAEVTIINGMVSLAALHRYLPHDFLDILVTLLIYHVRGLHVWNPLLRVNEDLD